MYCSSCGVEVAQELNYCNRCGANLNPANLVPRAPVQVKLTGPTIALGATVVLSLAAIFGGADSLAVRGVHPTGIVWMAIFAFAMVFGIASLTIRLWINLVANSSARAEQRTAQLKKPQPNPQLAAPPTGPMNAPVSSVTDHTTRIFEPVYRERRK